MGSIKSIPVKRQVEIIQNSPWPGVTVQWTDATTGEPEELTVTGQVRTDTIANGGVLLAECDVDTTGDPADYRYLVSLDATATAALPVRQLFIEVDAARDGEDPMSVFRLTASVLGEINAPEEEPAP